MRAICTASPLRLLALALGLLLSLSACTSVESPEVSPEKRQDLMNARALHGGGDQEIDRALELFSHTSAGEKAESEFASLRAKELHVSHLHRVTIDFATIGRRFIRQDSEGNNFVTPDSVTHHAGWIAQLASARGGLVETIFYDKNWSRMALLTPEGFLTIGNGVNRWTISYKVDVHKGAELVYKSPARYGLRSYEEDMALIETFSKADGLTGEYGVASNDPTPKVIRDIERIHLESRRAADFGLFPRSSD